MTDARSELMQALVDLRGHTLDATIAARRKPTPEMLELLEARLSGAAASLESALVALDVLRAEMGDGGEYRCPDCDG